MKDQTLFSTKSKENISKCRLLKFLPSIQSVKRFRGVSDSAALSLVILACPW